jgi:hypothetical protein
MNDQTGTVVSVLGFYLSLISLLASLFFIQLGNWWREVAKTEQKWSMYRRSPAERDKQIECYLEASDQKGPAPRVGFGLLTTFILILAAFAGGLAGQLAQNRIFVALYIPGGLFIAIYLIASISYLAIGHKTASRVADEARKALIGK